MTTIYLGQVFNEENWLEELLEYGITKYDFFPRFYGKTVEDCLDHILNDPLFDEDHKNTITKEASIESGIYQYQITTLNLNTGEKATYSIIIHQYVI